jgi:hypothetical protein
MRLAAVFLSIALLAGTAPATASAITETRPLEVSAKFASALDPDVPVVSAAGKTGADTASAEVRAGYTTPLVKAKAPLPKPAVRTARTPSGARSSSSSSSQPKVGAAPAGPAKPAAAAPKPAASSSSTLAQARSLLASRIAMYPILKGATVEIGDTKGNASAICYYKSGRIVINANHKASLERIINHEIWHIIDWRDNGQINWGESVPPSNAADFRG